MKADLSENETAEAGSVRVVALGPLPSDPYFVNQWHLRNIGQSGGTPGVDLRLFYNGANIWEDFTGAGVHVGIIDTGVDTRHPDLNGNYDASREAIVNGRRVDGFVERWGESYHGTAVAGIIAAERNGVGVVGIAYDAAITSIPAIPDSDSGDPPVPILEAVASMRHFDVVNNSWGFAGFQADNPNHASFQDYFAALDAAWNQGRGGLGTIIVKAAGNGRSSDHNTNADGTDSCYATIAVAALDHNGYVAAYSSEGPGLLVSAPAGGFSDPGRIWTTDRSDGFGYDSVAGSEAYAKNFNGTSAAAPMVSGVVALMLDANPALSARDVQEILAYSARHTGSAIGGSHASPEKYDWQWNAAENWNGGALHFSNDYGFGLVDAHAAVRLAEYWLHHRQQQTQLLAVDATPSVSPVSIPDNNLNGVSFTFTLSAAMAIESVELTLWGTHTYVGDLEIDLVSPSGTVSSLWNDNLSSEDIPTSGWTLKSNLFRGEAAAGIWTVRIRDTFAQDVGVINSAKLTVRGEAATADDLYVYTDEFVFYAATQPARAQLNDEAGTDTINAASVTGDSVIDLRPGATSTLAGTSLVLGATTVVEHAIAGDGDDRLAGNDADNLLIGGRGNDTLTGGAGRDTLIGDRGNDSYWVTADDTVIEGAGGGIDTVYASFGFDLRLFPHVENLTLLDSPPATKQSSATLAGNAANNVLTGNAAENRLFGFGGKDTLHGGAAGDVLAGGAKRDVLIGGDGADIFQFGARIESKAGKGRDVILDFEQGADVIDLSAIDTGKTPGDQAFTWIGSAKFSGARGELHYLRKGGFVLVEGDGNGDGRADFQLAVHGAGLSKLFATDFDL